MPKLLHAESTLTDRYQTTIPEPIREALHLGKRDKIAYELGEDGQVSIARAEQEDPILNQFLLFLANDIKTNPSRIQTLSSTLYKRAQSVISGVSVDLDVPLSDEDE